MVNVFGQAGRRVRQPAHRQHRHPVRARGPPERAGHARSSSSTSTPRSAGSTTTASDHLAAGAAGPHRPRPRLPDGRGELARTTWTRSPSSTCADPTRAPSTTCTAPTPCERASSATSGRRPTRCCGGARCRSSATSRSSTRRSSPSTRGWAGSNGTDATWDWPARSSRTAPPRSPSGAPTASAMTSPSWCATRPSPRTGHRGWPPGARTPTTRSSAR